MAELAKRFETMYGRRSRLYGAPGRVNLIGEHTDYNDGWVMPAAIGFRTWVAIAPRPDHKLQVHSENFAESVEADLNLLPPRPARRHWSDYVFGVAATLEQAGRRLRGADLLIRGEVPIGAGLSSSAALEVATGYALLANSGVPINRLERNDMAAFGIFMGESHRSLRDDFAVSSTELELLVRLAEAAPGVFGARLTGGGFGGCTINVVQSAAVDGFKDAVGQGYKRKTGRWPEIYVSAAAEGVEEVDWSL